MRQLKIDHSITNRDSDSFDRYLNDIGKIDLLTVEEEIALARLIKQGDKAALDRLVKANLRFVVSVAKKYQGKELRLGDLVSEGNLGLIKAAYRFDETKGFKFISFAVWWIRQSILQAIADQKRMIKLPGNQVVGITKINKVADVLEQKFERAPTYEEISELAELSTDKVVDYILSAPMTYSLDMQMDEDSSFSLLNTMVDENSPETDALMLNESRNTDLNRMLRVLPERQQKIIKVFYGLDNHIPLNLDDMVGVFHLSKERIRQLKDQALRTLRSDCKKSYLLEYN